MNDRLITAALTLAHVALIGGLAATTMATPAQAQGTTSDVANNGKSCPTGWRSGKSHTPMVGFDVCKPSSSNPPAIYLKTGSSCAAGYRVDYSWCTTLPVAQSTAHAQTSSLASLTKAAATNRCPSGYKTDQADTMNCVTESATAPTSRAKGSRPCAANEIDEYGFWCTSNYEAITAGLIKGYAMADYNTIYFLNRGKLAQPDIPGLNLTPVYIKRFGNTEGQQASATASNGSVSTNTPSKSCDTAAQQGAAIGGAVAGSKGKALGGLAGAALGGLGKKKKSGC